MRTASVRTMVLFVVALLVAVALPGSAAVASTAAAGHHATSPVLGKKGLFGPNGRGWGTAHPKTVFNGGDPNGDVSSLRWYGWGTSKARGYGLGSQFKPGGGYYAKPVKVQFHAQKISRCSKNGPRAYTYLSVRFQTKPGGPWHHWSRWAGLTTLCSQSR